ncbi:MAG: helix-turn-helix domain-containing protein [Waterburya sp.]
MRKTAGLTQQELAEILSTKKSNISRLENVYSSSSATENLDNIGQIPS